MSERGSRRGHLARHHGQSLVQDSVSSTVHRTWTKSRKSFPGEERTRVSELDSLHQTQHTQQLGAAELNEVSILRREPNLFLQNVNGFAGTNEINGFFSNRNHAGFSIQKW